MLKAAALFGIDPAIIAYVQEIIDRHRSIAEPTHVRYLGQDFVINPGVFSPFIAPSGRVSLSFASWPIFQGKRVLDVGCGAGIQACLIGASGAQKVVGIDINPAAIESARTNALSLGLSNVDFRIGDLFEQVLDGDRFDIVFADLPLMSKHPKDMLERAFYDYELASIKRFLRELPSHLRRVRGAKGYLCLSNLDEFDIEEASELRSTTVMRLAVGDVDLTLAELAPK